MAAPRTIPIGQSPDIVTFTILMNGKSIPRTYNVINIGIRLELNRISTANVTLTDGDAAAGDFKASSSNDFIPGNEIEIKVGYHSDESTVFKGVVISHGIKVNPDGRSFLILECKDKAVKMTVGRRNKYYYDQTESDIFQEIVESYNIENQVHQLSTQHREVVQYDSTDWDFLISRVEKNGLFCWLDQETFKIFPPDTSSSAVLDLTYGATIYEFEAEIDARNQYRAVKSFSWDYPNQLPLEADGNSAISLNGNLTSESLADVIGLNILELKHGGKVAEAELRAWADAQLMRSQLSKTRGRVRFQGVPEVKPGVIVNLNGLGERFNGKSFVSGVNHVITQGNWKTDAQLGLPDQWFAERFQINQIPATGLLPAISGLQIGIVTQLENDPDGENRILVRLPIISADEQGIWARVAKMDAGNNRGAFFLPDIGDEVIVGFINDDPRHAVVLGMLHSSAKPAPLTADDDNHEKGWVTRSGIQMIFNDDQKSLTVETPAGKTLVMDETADSIRIEDEHANKILMHSEGIVIESRGTIELKASQDLTMEGLNVSTRASAQFKAEGSGSSEVISSGSTTIKGSVVQIN